MAPIASITTYGIGTVTPKTTDYVGNKVYENNQLKRILIEDSYIENNQYTFYSKDHLGNNRVVANACGVVLLKNHYKIVV